MTCLRYILRLLVLTALLVASGYFLARIPALNLYFPDIPVLTLSFLAITSLALCIFHRGQKKEPESRVMHLIVAISLKMLLEMVLVLLWFFVAKKTSLTCVISFFVLYLAFSLFSILLMVKALREKSL